MAVFYGKTAISVYPHLERGHQHAVFAPSQGLDNGHFGEGEFDRTN